MQVFPPSPAMSVEILPNDEIILSMDEIFLIEQHTNHPSIPHDIAVQGSLFPPYGDAQELSRSILWVQNTKLMKHKLSLMKSTWTVT
jgi:hypothetical protein